MEGLGPQAFEKFKNVFFDEEKPNVQVEDAWRLLDHAAICGYLPDDHSVEEMSRIKKDRKDILDCLYEAGKWVLILEDVGDEEQQPLKRVKWKNTSSQILDDRKGEVKPLNEELNDREKEFLKYWEPFFISNNLFLELEKLASPQSIEYVNNLSFKEQILADQQNITYIDIMSHRQNMLKVLSPLEEEVATELYAERKVFNSLMEEEKEEFKKTLRKEIEKKQTEEFSKKLEKKAQFFTLQQFFNLSADKLKKELQDELMTRLMKEIQFFNLPPNERKKVLKKKLEEKIEPFNLQPDERKEELKRKLEEKNNNFHQFEKKNFIISDNKAEMEEIQGFNTLYATLEKHLIENRSLQAKMDKPSSGASAISLSVEHFLHQMTLMGNNGPFKKLI